MNLIFCSDVSAPDYNGAIATYIELAARGKTPFVASRTLLSAQGRRQFGKPMAVEIPKHQMTLLKRVEEWDLFQRGEYILFLPKSLLPKLTPEEKLKALDFRTDGTLKQIGMDEAWEPEERADLAGFKGLFSDHPEVEKLIYVSGHGNAQTVAAMKNTIYQDFLRFLDTQKCRGLTITSCMSGGESSLFEFPCF